VTGTSEAAPARRVGFYREVLERVRALPGVESASGINHLPLAGDIWGFPYFVEGRPRPRPGEGSTGAYRVVLPGYFATMHLPLVRGRDFTNRDDGTAPGVIIVNEWFAEKVWPGEDPIGKRLTLDEPTEQAQWLTVVGVARNAMRAEWGVPPDEEMYLPYLQSPDYLEGSGGHVAYLTIVVRAAGDPTALVPALRAIVSSLDPQVPLAQVCTMEEAVSLAIARPRFSLVLLGVFACVALLLAGVGIYGVMSYAVSRRTNEIGVRMALGATRADVLRLVVGQGLALALVGTAVGLVGALALTRLMSTLLYGVSATNPATFIAASAVLTLVGLVACYVPAHRATRIDPLVALRDE
jgi:putative ABC transport system permease protein